MMLVLFFTWPSMTHTGPEYNMNVCDQMWEWHSPKRVSQWWEIRCVDFFLFVHHYSLLFFLHTRIRIHVIHLWLSAIGWSENRKRHSIWIESRNRRVEKKNITMQDRIWTNRRKKKKSSVRINWIYCLVKILFLYIFICANMHVHDLYP